VLDDGLARAFAQPILDDAESFPVTRIMHAPGGIILIQKLKVS